MLRGNCRSGFRVTTPLSAPPGAAKSLAELWTKIPRVEKGFTTIDSLHEAPEEETAFALWFDETGLVVLVRADITASVSVRPGARKADSNDISSTDSLEIEIDTKHNHSDYLWFQFDTGGTRVASRRTVLQFALRCDRVKQDRPVADNEWSVICEMTKEAWFSQAHIPFQLLNMKSAADLVTWGFNVVQRRYIGRRLVESAWSPLRGESQSPWDFGEVLAPATPVQVTSLDFGEVYYDWNTLKFIVKNLSNRPQKIEAKLHAWCQGHDFQQDQKIVLKPKEKREAGIRFELDSRETQRQDIELMLYGGQRLVYIARFSAGHSPHHGGSCMVLKHGVRWFESKPPEDSAPSDPAFQVKKRRYILSRLPDFPEMGWWGGPRGDWILRDRRGSKVKFNLLSARILDDLGDMIARRFATDEERVIAATLLAHRMMIYSATGNVVQGLLSPLGALRYGVGICSGYTCVEHGILLGTPRTDGRRGYRSWYTSAYNHTILTVELPNYCTVVDPTVGSFHYTRDNSRLATDEELFKDPSLSLGTLAGREKDYGPESPRGLEWYGALPYPPEVPGGRGCRRAG